MKKLLIIQHIEREGPGNFIDIADQLKFDVSICRVDLNDDLPDLDQVDGLLILGGPMGLNDRDKVEFSWLNKEICLLKQVLALEIPIIGICLGAQLLAFAAGGSIEPLLSKETKKPLAEIGWGVVSKVPFNGLEPVINSLIVPLSVLHWHADRIILPESATLLASSPRCNEQMFRIGRNAYGMQFHAEVEEFAIRRWIAEDEEFISQNLGPLGQSKLLNNLASLTQRSSKRRKEFLYSLFEILWSSDI